jgi:hypothetical protein
MRKIFFSFLLGLEILFRTMLYYAFIYFLEESAETKCEVFFFILICICTLIIYNLVGYFYSKNILNECKDSSIDLCLEDFNDSVENSSTYLDFEV